MYDWQKTFESLNIGAGKAPQPARTVPHPGLGTGTLVATDAGWQPVETLRAGSRVWTFDSGLQPVVETQVIAARRRDDGATEPQEMVKVPAGALDNRDDLLLLAQTGLLLECENGCDIEGDPFAVIPVAALEGLCGIRNATEAEKVALHRLRFAQEQAIYIDSGLLVHCPFALPCGSGAKGRYDVKPLAGARDFLTDLDLAELALREANEDFFGESVAHRVA